MSLQRPALLFLFCLFFLSWDFPNFLPLEKEAENRFRSGLAHLEKRELAMAREDLVASLFKKSNFLQARMELAKAYFYAGLFEEMDSEFSTLAQLFPNDKNLSLAKQTYGAYSETLENSNLFLFRSLLGDEFKRFRFKSPTDLFISEEGRIYVLGFESSNLVVMDAGFHPLQNTGGGFFRRLKNPAFLAYKRNKVDDVIFVSDTGSDCIFLFDKKGRYQTIWGKKGSGPGELIGPEGLVLDKNGHLFISDQGNHRIQKWDETGKFLMEFGNQELITPSGLYFDDVNSILFVVDRGKKAVMQFDLEGNFLSEWKTPKLSKPRSLKKIGTKLYLTDEDEGLYIFDGTNWELFSNFKDTNGVVRNFDRAFSTASDQFGTLYVSDYRRHRVDVFTNKDVATSNKQLYLERIDVSRFPDMSLYLRLNDVNGENIRGLDRFAFQIKEMGGREFLPSLAKLNTEQKRFRSSLVFLSSPDLPRDFDSLNQILKPFFSGMNVEDKLLLLNAEKEVVMEKEFSNTYLDILNIIRKSKPTEQPNSLKAIYRSLQQLSLEIGPRAVVVLGSNFTNPETSHSWLRIQRISKIYQIPIYFLYTGKKEDLPDLIAETAEVSNGKVYFLQEEEYPYDLAGKIRTAKDTRYILSFKSGTSSRLPNSYIPVEVEAAFRETKGKAFGGYYIPNE